MPRKVRPSEVENAADRKPPPPSKRDEVEWGGFINLKLYKEDAAAFKEWVSHHGQEVWVELDNVVCAGLKYSLGWDSENDCYTTSFTGQGVLSDPKRYCLTARAGTFEEATALLMYKHAVMLGGDWGNFRPSDSSSAWG